MATVKIKFRLSTVNSGLGTILYQVIHNRVACQQKTSYRFYSYEWNNHLSEVILPRFNDDRKRFLSEISDKIRIDIETLQKIISGFEQSGCGYAADDATIYLDADITRDATAVQKENVKVTIEGDNHYILLTDVQI